MGRGMLKRITAAFLCACLFATSAPFEAFADTGGFKSEAVRLSENMTDSIKEGLEKEDASMKEEYPQGIYAFASLAAEVEEKNHDPLAVYLVRHGGTQGRQKVHIKLVDYSAEYGEDYYVKLSRNVFEKELEKNEHARPILYQFTDDEASDEADVEEELREIYGEENAEEIMELMSEDAVSEETVEGMEEASGEEVSDDASADVLDDDIQQADFEETYDEEESVVSGLEEVFDEGASAEGDAEGDDGLSEDEGIVRSPAVDKSVQSPLEQINQQTSLYTGNDAPVFTEVDIDEEGQEQAEKSARLQDLLFPGSEADVVFEDGEQIKEIYVYPVNNAISDGDRVFEIRIDTEQEDKIAWQPGENSLPVTIKDDEPDETAHISLLSKKVRVDDEKKAEVVLERHDGLYKVSSVDYTVSDKKTGTALVNGKVMIMPGMDKRTVRFSLSNICAGGEDELVFRIKDPVGAEITGKDECIISLASYKRKHKAELPEEKPLGDGGQGRHFEKNDADNPFHVGCTQYADHLDIGMNNDGSWYYNVSATCSTKTEASGGKLEVNVYEAKSKHVNSCAFATLATTFCPVTVKSFDLNWEHSDSSTIDCNRAYVAVMDYGFGWHDSGNRRLAEQADADGDCSINFLTGETSGFDDLQGYKNEYMDLSGLSGSANAASDRLYVTIGAKKTSDAMAVSNGMEVTVHSMRLNFRDYNLQIMAPENKTAGTFSFAGGLYNSTVYPYNPVRFENKNSKGYYLKGIQVSSDQKNWIDVNDEAFDAEHALLGMDDKFWNQCAPYVDYKNGVFYVRPVYAEASVNVHVVGDEHGGVSVKVNGNVTEVKKREEKDITCKYGDVLELSPADVVERYAFSEYVMTPSKINGGEDPGQVIDTYPDVNAKVELGYYDYTLTPRYTSTGTVLDIKYLGTVPDGCGVRAKTVNAYGDEVDKLRYTYAQDNLRNGQLMQLAADCAEGYRARWIIMTKGHENYGLSCYGDTLYYRIMNPQSEIGLAFEKIKTPVYGLIKGRTGMHEGTILNPPMRDENGNWMGEDVPLSNVSVEMGPFTGLSGEDGSYILYSHTAEEKEGGGNVTSYLTMDASQFSEKHSMLFIRNGVVQPAYIDVVRDTQSEADGKDADHPMVFTCPDQIMDFFGNGPVPSDFYVMSSEDSSTDPTIPLYAPTVPLEDKNFGFVLKLDGVLDTEGKDLVDHVKFSVYHKDGSFVRGFNVNREEPGQTLYQVSSYEMTDDNGVTGNVYINGTMDLVDGDEIRVDVFGKRSDKNGNSYDYSYGSYVTGVKFVKVLYAGSQVIGLPDISPDGSKLPNLDMLGAMLPSFKFGRVGVNAIYDESDRSLIVNAGFDVAQINKSLYDTEEKKRVEQAKNVKSQIDSNEAKIKEQNDKAGNARTQLEKLDASDPNNKEAIDACNKTISDAEAELEKLNAQQKTLNEQYQKLGGTTDTKPMTDPLTTGQTKTNAPDMKADVTSEEINNANEVAENALSKPNLATEAINLFSDPVKTKIKQLENQAKRLGIDKPFGHGFKAAGSISANLGVQIGLSLRFRVKVDATTGKGEWCFDYATVYANVSAGVTAMYYFVIPQFPIPLYLGASLTGSVGLYAGVTCVGNTPIKMDEFDEGEYDPDKIMVMGMVPIILGIEVFAGAGLRSLLCLETGAGLMQKFNLASYSDPTNLGFVHKRGVGKTSFYGYLSTSVLFFTFKWKFLQKNWDYVLYDEAAEGSLGEEIAGTFTDIGLDKLQVEEASPARYQDELSHQSTLAWDGSVKVADGLTGTVSEVVSLGDRAYLTAFEGVLADEDRTGSVNDDNYSYNNRAVYLTYYDGSNRITRILQKDGTNDSSLHMEDLGDEILISFASADRTFDRDDLFLGNDLKNEALIRVLSSMDMYALILPKTKTGITSFLEKTDEERLAQIQRLTNDGDMYKRDGVSENITSRLRTGTQYLGYGYENGRAVKVGDQIYLFFTAVDYNPWQDREEVVSLSDIVDADGYVMYRIYDCSAQKWTDDYVDPMEAGVYEDLGFGDGIRMADIHPVTANGTESVLPLIGEMDADTVCINGRDKVLLAYLVEGDQSLSNNNENNNVPSKLLYFALMDPAVIDNGRVTRVPVFEAEKQVFDRYKDLCNPNLIRFRDSGSEEPKEELYLTLGVDDDLEYVNLTQAYDRENGLEDEDDFMKIAVRSTDENGFSCRNGFSACADDRGHFYSVWAQSNGNSQGLWISTMSRYDGVDHWSLPAPMSGNEEDERYMSNPSIAADDEGNMLIAHNAYELSMVTEQQDGVEAASYKEHKNDSFMLTKERPAGSAAVSDPVIPEEYPRAGSDFSVEAQVSNTGCMKADKVTVSADLIKLDADEQLTEHLLDHKESYFEDMLPSATEQIRVPFTMKQEYLDMVTHDDGLLIVRVTAIEEGYEKDADTAEARVGVGARYEFSETGVQGYLADTDNSRFYVTSKVTNTGNVDSSHTSYSLMVSNEKRFVNSGNAWDGTNLKSNLSQEEMSEALRYADGVYNDDAFKDWLAVTTYAAGDEIGDLPVGGVREVKALSGRISNECYSDGGIFELALTAMDDELDPLSGVKASDSVVTPVSKDDVKENMPKLTICEEGTEVSSITLKEGSEDRLTASLYPVKNALKFNTGWSSTDDSVAVVFPDGTLKALKSGNTTVNLTAEFDEDNKYTTSCEVKVLPADVPDEPDDPVIPPDDPVIPPDNPVDPPDKPKPDPVPSLREKALAAREAGKGSILENEAAVRVMDEKGKKFTIDLAASGVSENTAAPSSQAVEKTLHLTLLKGDKVYLPLYDKNTAQLAKDENKCVKVNSKGLIKASKVTAQGADSVIGYTTTGGVRLTISVSVRDAALETEVSGNSIAVKKLKKTTATYTGSGSFDITLKDVPLTLRVKDPSKVKFKQDVVLDKDPVTGDYIQVNEKGELHITGYIKEGGKGSANIPLISYIKKLNLKVKTKRK